MDKKIKDLQLKLYNKGYHIQVDGINGPQTRRALRMYSLSLLDYYPPWLTELGKYYGLHEVRNKKELTKWLRSDGGLLGDPEKFPWCGDAIDTAIRNTLPNEPFDARLRKNPYWARNWMYFGEETEIALGAIVVLSRSGGGHVAAIVGQDPRRKKIYMRGGNQKNRICDSWVYADRVIGYRKPLTWPHKLQEAPILDSSNRAISINEA